MTKVGLRVYVSGPMTGHENLNREAFAKVSEQLMSLGFEVVNPAEVVKEEDTTWSDYMREDISAMMDCDVIIMLPGWQNSKGAGLEHHIAMTLGFHVVYIPDSEVKTVWPF